MEFKFKNFGKAGNGLINLKDLAIICGPNNTGKSYVNYAIYSLLKNFSALFDFGVTEDCVKNALSDLMSNETSEVDLAGVCQQLANVKSRHVKMIGSEIGKHFQLPESNFESTEISIKLSEMDLEDSISITDKKFSDCFGLKYSYISQKIACTFFATDNAGKLEKLADDIKNPEFIKGIMDSLSFRIFNLHYARIVPTPFAITSERTGIPLFYKAFDYLNKATIRQWNYQLRYNKGNSHLEPLDSFHAEPIDDNIDHLRFFERIKEFKSYIIEENCQDILDLMANLLDNGSFRLNNDALYFQPSKQAVMEESSIPLQASSASVKTLFLFDMFVKHLAQKGSILIVDEPELNLHIDKQIMVARLVARLVNSGIKVLVSTHSDNFVREINNMITLKSADKKKREKVMTKYGVIDNDLLRKSQLTAYKLDGKGRIGKLRILNSGVDPEDWNQIIGNENIKSEEIFNLIG